MTTTGIPPNVWQDRVSNLMADAIYFHMLRVQVIVFIMGIQVQAIGI